MNPEIESEFLRIPDAVKFSGLSRGVLYRLISEGRLKSKSLRSKGAIRGVRLISKDAIRECINGFDDGREEAK